MSSILLYHHLGLGDHIMCHGIVREYCKKYDHVTIFTKPHNHPSVSFMYHDIKNLAFIQGDDIFAENYILKNSSKYDEVKRIGFENLDRGSGVPLEWQFYKIAGVPFQKKWDSFFVDRDLKKEQELFNLVAPKGDYAFVHEDRERHYNIQRKRISKDCAIILPDVKVSDNIFDYCTVIEKAKEIHVIDSSFMFLIDCLPYQNPEQKLFVHRYARENNDWQLPILKKDWVILTTERSALDPLKDILRKIFKTKSSLLKRIIRKIFWHMGWPMFQPDQPNLNGLIQRYVPSRSFMYVHLKGNDSKAKLHISENMGATENTTQDASSLGHTVSPASDLVFYSDIFPQDITSLEFLMRLRSATKQILIINIPTAQVSSSELESLLTKNGFGIRERHLFPTESCFVCRAI